MRQVERQFPKKLPLGSHFWGKKFVILKKLM